MKKLLSFVWPPYELYLVQREIKRSAVNEDPWVRALEELKIDFPSQSDAELADAEKLASSVLEAEIRRKDVLESKAATFAVTPTVATAITAAIAALTKDLGLSRCIATFVIICYAATLIHLLGSCWYAILVRRAEAFIVLSAINARDLLSKTRAERVVTRLAFARMNESALVMKSNRLVVSEELFLRGIAFLATAAFVTLMAHVAG